MIVSKMLRCAVNVLVPISDRTPAVFTRAQILPAKDAPVARTKLRMAAENVLTERAQSVRLPFIAQRSHDLVNQAELTVRKRLNVAQLEIAAAGDAGKKRGARANDDGMDDQPQFIDQPGLDK